MTLHEKKKTKAERTKEREIIGQYHQKVTEDALDPLYQRFIEWKNGELPYYELTEHIHEFHKLNRKIWTKFNYNPDDSLLVFEEKKELRLLTEEEKEEFKFFL
ncbi:hypothetical protein QA612_17985 [Evansella sp. AB-P1]|uniref:hypothetical protein n=1 Tax=Evansella sp. AB-P1 TaxID=3037653 RepID=UPI00241F1B56|nr:hypothetical protein [Evansella sp. AB-P1]MDG5789354.1 hypothetical protein [Evansella sp. AB-P1]